MIEKPGNKTELINSIKETLITYNIVVIPCYESFHCVLLFKYNMCFYFIDSFNHETKSYEKVSSLLKLLKKVYEEKKINEFVVREIKVNQQTDLFSCGYRVIFYSAIISLKSINGIEKLSLIEFKEFMFEIMINLRLKFNELTKNKLQCSTPQESENLKEFVENLKIEIYDIINYLVN